MTLIDRTPFVDGEIARIGLTRGLVAIIDAADVDLVAGHTWRADPKAGTFYASTQTARPSRRTILMHRLILGAQADVLVDHANHDGLDNRRANLRVATKSQNMRNRRGVPSHSTSGLLGATWHRRDQRWMSQVRHNGEQHYLGMFDTARDAATARDEFIRTHLQSEFAVFNFPREGERGVEEQVSA